MKFYGLVLALAFLAANAPDSWGQSKQPPAKTSQQNSAQKERGTEDSPVVVKVLPTEKTKTEFESEKEKQESDRQLVKLTGDLAKYTKLLFAATALLAVITAGLVILGFFQVRDAKRSITAAETAANAALRQTNAMIAMESPIFAIRQLKLVGFENEQGTVATVDPVPPGLPTPFCRPLILMENRGRTEMTINRVFCDWVVAPTVDETPEYHFEEVWNGALVKESSAWFPSQNGIRLNQFQAETIANFGQFLWVYGKIIYTDFMGDRFEHGYIARWTMGQGFIRDPLANYEYKRKI